MSAFGATDYPTDKDPVKVCTELANYVKDNIMTELIWIMKIMELLNKEELKIGLFNAQKLLEKLSQLINTSLPMPLKVLISLELISIPRVVI